MTKNKNFIVIIVLVINILVVWLPNQFQTTGIQEEWRYRAPFDGHITTYNDIGSDSSEEQFYTRPFYGVMNALTYIVTPDSFLSNHLLLIILLFIKGFTLYAIFKSLFPDMPLWGYLCALLLIFYPSDTGIVSFRTFHHHLAIVMVLLSIYFLIQYYQHSHRRYILMMMISQAIAGLSSETGYPVFFFVPFIILVIEKRISRRFIINTILFYVVPALTFLYSFVLIVVVETSWQRTAIGSYTIREYLRNIYNLYEYNFVTTWQNIGDYITTQATPSDLFVFLATMLVTFIGSVAITRQHNQTSIDHPLLIKLVLMVLGGGMAVLLGYTMFLPSRTHVLTHFRVYLLSSVGVAIVIGTLMVGLFYRLSQNPVKYLILVGFSIVVGLSGVFANKTHHEYLEISNQQAYLVRQITEIAPALNSNAYIVIKTQSNTILKRLSLGEIQKPVLFTPMLQYIYEDYDNIQAGVICFTGYLTCQFTPSGMNITASNFLNINLPVSYDELILFNITKQGELTLITEEDALLGYNPTRLINQDASPPRRMQTIYGDTD
jgi:hypothetical protein